MSVERRNLPVAAGFPSLRSLQTALPCTKMGVFRSSSRRSSTSSGEATVRRRSVNALGRMAWTWVRRVPRLLACARRRLRDSDPEMLTAPHLARERSGGLTCGNVEGGLNQHPSLDPFAGVRRSRQKEARERFEYDSLAPVKENLLK
jgi:hypothetical protein